MTLSCLLLFIAGLTLAGCERVGRSAAAIVPGVGNPTLVFSPGYKVIVDGKKVPIFGFDECPKSDPVSVAFFGTSPSEDRSDCVVLRKDRADVLVAMVQPTGVVKERWAIVRGSGKPGEAPSTETFLRRPNGSFVLPGELK